MVGLECGTITVEEFVIAAQKLCKRRVKSQRQIKVESTVILEAIALYLKKYNFQVKNFSQELIPRNFIREIVSLLDWKNCAQNPMFLNQMYDIILLIRRHFPQRTKALEEGRVFNRLLEILRLFRETQEVSIEHNNPLTSAMAHMIAEFLPALTRSDWCEDVDIISSGILLSGSDFKSNAYKFDEDFVINTSDVLPDDYIDLYQAYDYSIGDYKEEKQIVVTLNITIAAVFTICRDSDCPLVYHALFLKIIHWALCFDVIEDFIEIEEIIEYLKCLIGSTEREKVIVGLAMTRVLLSSHAHLFRQHQLLETIKKSFSIVNPRRWIEVTCEVLAADDRQTPIVLINLIEDPKYTHYPEKKKLVLSMLDYIMPNFRENGGNKETDLELNYSKLTSFVRTILHIPEKSEVNWEKEAISREGIKLFGSVVSYVSQVVRIEASYDFTSTIRDMPDVVMDKKSLSPSDVILNPRRTAEFDRVLGPSLYPYELKKEASIRALRLISILHEVNENWGILFGYPTTKRLISRKVFSTDYYSFYFNNLESISKEKRIERASGAAAYHFLFSYSVRREIFCKSVQLDYKTCMNPTIEVEKGRTLDGIIPDMTSANKSSDTCYFSFTENQNCSRDKETEMFYTEFSRDSQRGELQLWIGGGSTDCTQNPKTLSEVDEGRTLDNVIYGMTSSNKSFDDFSINTMWHKEMFYNDFSRGCQRGDLQLWIEGGSTDSTGNDWSVGGLFPKSNVLTKDTALQYAVVGRVIARCIVDDQRLDINFSKAFIKRLLGNSAQYQDSVSDLKDIMPQSHGIITKLMDVLNNKWNVENDVSLSAKDRIEAMSKISLDGISFEDFSSNFAIHGYPHMGLANLTIENVGEYLKLFIWSVVYKATEECFTAITKGIESIISTSSLKLFYLDEIEDFFRGSKVEAWTMDSLKTSCIYPNHPVVHYLFEILSSCSDRDRQLFVKFVTGSPRLPCGGLKNLEPRLVVEMLGYNSKPIALKKYKTLLISEYSSKEALREDLELAIWSRK